MNWDQIEGKWKEMKGKARSSWGELTDDELDQIGGKKDQLVGKLQQSMALSAKKQSAKPMTGLTSSSILLHLQCSVSVLSRSAILSALNRRPTLYRSHMERCYA